MTDWEAVGAALFFSAIVGGVGYAAVWTFMPDLAATFVFFYTLATVGLCLVAGENDEQ